jgi:hypothetical protein
MEASSFRQVFQNAIEAIPLLLPHIVDSGGTKEFLAYE